MRDDDETLAGIDLTAWQPPAPPANLADAVITRLRAPVVAAAIEPHERPSRRPRWHAGTAGVAVALAGLAAWASLRAPRSCHGEQIAARAAHVELDGSVADLDAGAELRWDRDRHRITAHQTRGTVRWTIADDDTLVIDPGGSAAVTIEASGASLRVEVPMNVSDARMLGATTLSAAVAALVTVVVYQGHVQATSAGQTVNVAPGATIALGPQRPPEPVDPVGPVERRPEEPQHQLAVGASPADVQQLKDQLKVADEKIASLTAELAARTTDAPPIPVAPQALEAGRVAGSKTIAPDDDTKLAVARSGQTKIFGTFKLCVDTAGTVSSLQMMKSTGVENYDQKIVQAMHDWRYRPFLHDGKPTPVCTAATFVYAPSKSAPEIDPPRTTAASSACAAMNVDDLLAQSQNMYTSGYANAALSLVTKALGCKQDVRMYRLAATYACAAHDAKAAQAMFAKVPAQFQGLIEQKCQQENVPLH
jgi:outer membrane biosynthesis protein TonB